MKTMKTLKRITLLIICSLSFNISYAQSPVNSVGSGCALNFNGTSNYVDCGDPASNVFDMTGDATIEAWVSVPVITSSDMFTIVGKDVGPGNNIDKWFFVLRGDGRLGFHVNGLTTPLNGQWIYSSFFTLNLNKSYHAVCVKNGNNISFYINGIAIGGGVLGQPITDFANPMKIGYAEPCCVFNGQIDEVRIWNKALTQTEIQQNMCKKLTGTEAGLVGYWRFDDCGGSIATDASGNGNNGILH